MSIPAVLPPIRIAAAIIDDAEGRLLLVRKAGTNSFMQAGGKIEADEDPWSALRRELREEIGLDLADDERSYLGCFFASAANELGRLVEASLFHVRTNHTPIVAAEIAEAVWVTHSDAASMVLAPLTRDFVLPMAADLASGS
ncbi:NUDIX hydrolase [Aurantiacibacter flavus]|uniref:NUDIX domain-containing protein n=1 Tax=Aurantiacibacter flavus TaxID=3145232 RepID=A0ABV0CT81_9SPHN